MMRFAGLLIGAMSLVGGAQAATLLRTVSSTGISTTAVSATGNISAAKFLGDGSALTGVTAVAGSSGSDTQMQYGNNGALAGANVYYVSSTGYMGLGKTPAYRLDVLGDIKTTGTLYTSGSTSTYGALTIDGSKAGWGGINFKNGGSNLKTLMVNTTYSGVYNTADNAWDWLWAGGTLNTGIVPAANVAAGMLAGGSVQLTSNALYRTYGFNGPEYDGNNGGYYVDPNGTSIMNDVRINVIYAQPNTGYYIQPHGGSRMNAIYADLVYTYGAFNVNGNSGIGGIVPMGCGDYAAFTGGIMYSQYSGGGCNGDVAEHYGTEETLHRGDIVMLGTTTASREFRVSIPSPGETSKTTYTITTANVRKATAEGRGMILGAVPTAPFTFSTDKIDPKDKPQEVALVGHVPVKMTLEGGPVKIGDPITVATNNPGKGMKATTSGRILGYALENYTREGDSKDGMIEVFVHLEEWESPDEKNAALDAVKALRAEFEAYKKAHP